MVKLISKLFEHLVPPSLGAIAECVKAGNANSLNSWGKYQVYLTSCAYLLRLGCFENRENVLQAELRLIPNQ